MITLLTTAGAVWATVALGAAYALGRALTAAEPGLCPCDDHSGRTENVALALLPT